jgi:flagellar L-ring protein precursor FlgH
MSLKRTLAVLCLASSLGGCAYFERLKDVGSGPTLSSIKNPVTEPGYRPVSMPMPAAEPASFNSNSLWRNGARAFFKDQRAARVGDILTVLVEITDKAEIENSSKRSRAADENATSNKLAGLEDFFLRLLPKGADLSNLVDLSSAGKSDGTGSIEREEKVVTKMAAVVTQVLPNGNMVIEGHQEVRVNFELRELIVAGVVRPEDITAENTIPVSKIAEARISYGGKGQISDVQRPRYGQELLDIILPF